MDEAEKRIQKAIEVIKKDPRGTFVEGDKKYHEAATDADADARAEETLAWLEANPNFHNVTPEEDEDEGEIVEAEITLIPKMSESQKEYWRSKRKRDEGSA